MQLPRLPFAPPVVSLRQTHPWWRRRYDIPRLHTACDALAATGQNWTEHI